MSRPVRDSGPMPAPPRNESLCQGGSVSRPGPRDELDCSPADRVARVALLRSSRRRAALWARRGAAPHLAAAALADDREPRAQARDQAARAHEPAGPTHLGGRRAARARAPGARGRRPGGGGDARGDRFPSLSLEVTEELANDVIASVLHGNADLGLAVCPVTTNGVASHRVREEEPVALVHHLNPLVAKESITMEELALLPLILWTRDESAGAYDFVLSLFHGRPPSSLTVLDRFDGAWWSQMVAG